MSKAFVPDIDKVPFSGEFSAAYDLGIPTNLGVARPNLNAPLPSFASEPYVSNTFVPPASVNAGRSLQSVTGELKGDASLARKAKGSGLPIPAPLIIVALAAAFILAKREGLSLGNIRRKTTSSLPSLAK